MLRNEQELSLSEAFPGGAVLLMNRHSSHGADIDDYSKDVLLPYLKRFELETEVVKTLPGHDETVEALQACLPTASTLVIALGGDGTIRQGATAAQSTEHVLLPGAFGNANVTAQNALRRDFMSQPHLALDPRQSEIRAINPLIFRVGREKHLGMSVVGAGMIALGAEVLEHGLYRAIPGYKNPDFREKVLEKGVLVGATALYLMSHFGRFEVIDEGEKFYLVDFTVSNVRNVAKHGITEARFTDAGAACFEIGTRRDALFRWSREIQSGEYRNWQLPVGVERRFRNGRRKVRGQCDGSVIMIPPGAEFGFMVAESVVNTVVHKSQIAA